MGDGRFSHRCSANTSTIYQAIVNTMIIKPPDIKSYWKTSWISEVPFFKLLMPRNRFQEIFWVLYVTHSDPCWPAKKIDMIKQLLQLLIPKFRGHYYPSKNLAIDETMVGFCGHFDAKPYAQKITVKLGIKAINMVDSKNWYLLDTLVYTGAETKLAQNLSHSLSLVRLSCTLCGVTSIAAIMYTDRYCTSIPVIQSLASHSTSFTGTVMKNCIDLPDIIRAKSFSLKRGDHLSFKCEQLLVTA